MRALIGWLLVVALAQGRCQVEQVARLQKSKQLILNHLRLNPPFYTSYNLREILHYLGRSYLRFSPTELDNLLSVQLVYDDDKILFPYYQKLHNKQFVPMLPLSHPAAPARNPMERLMLAGLYPDSLNFCYAFKEALQDTAGLSDEGFVRHMAHVVLARMWARSFASGKMECLSRKQLRDQRMQILRRLEKLKSGTDTWMEGVLALYWLQTPRRQMPDMLSVLDKVQCPDGSFRWDPHTEGCEAAHEHPTVLALWLLCLEEAGGRVASWAWPEK